tara:strand:- start:436 stop:567 length:132 start_codon:yes stop_codon:yes gene_type:complete
MSEYEKVLTELAFSPLVSTEVSLKIFRELRRIKKEKEKNEEKE